MVFVSGHLCFKMSLVKATLGLYEKQLTRGIVRWETSVKSAKSFFIIIIFVNVLNSK